MTSRPLVLHRLRSRPLRRSRLRAPARALSLAVALTLIASGSAHARADDAASTAGRAEKLFHEGEALFDARSFTEACAKFATSHDLDPKLGTLLNLAFCHESEGRTARARAEFDEALTWAVQKGQKDREQFAREHLAALEKRLSYVVLEAPEIEVDAIDVRVDGQPVPRNRWGAPLVVDPGLHMLTSTAPHKEPQPILFYVEPGPSTRTLRVPSLIDDPVAAAKLARKAPVAAAPAPPPKTTGLHARRTWAIVAFATGAVGVGVGAYLGVRAVSAADDLRTSCGWGPCGQAAADTSSNAHSFAAAAGASLGVGVVALGVGTWLSLTSAAPARAAPRASITPLASPHGAGVSLAGTF